MAGETNEYTMTFDHYEPLGDSIYRKIYCKDVRTSDGVLIKKHISLERDIAKKIIGPLRSGTILVFSAELTFQNIEFIYSHGITRGQSVNEQGRKNE